MRKLQALIATVTTCSDERMQSKSLEVCLAMCEPNVIQLHRRRTPYQAQHFDLGVLLATAGIKHGLLQEELKHGNSGGRSRDASDDPRRSPQNLHKSRNLRAVLQRTNRRVRVHLEVALPSLALRAELHGHLMGGDLCELSCAVCVPAVLVYAA